MLGYEAVWTIYAGVIVLLLSACLAVNLWQALSDIGIPEWWADFKRRHIIDDCPPELDALEWDDDYSSYPKA